MNEDELLGKFVEWSDESYRTEVPVGNCITRTHCDIDGFEGPLSLSADLVTESPSERTATIVEVKSSLNFTAIGQVLSYSQLYQADRERVIDKYRENPTLLSSADKRQRINHHISKEGDGIEDYVVKPEICELNRRIAVETVDPGDAQLLKICDELGIEVFVREGRRWVNTSEYDVSTGSIPDGNLDHWLNQNSRQTLMEDREQEVAEAFLTNQSSEVSVFYEVPIGHRAFPNASKIRSDIILNINGSWIMAEVKALNSGNMSRKFLTSVGQSIGYSIMFAIEWEIDLDNIYPASIMAPVPLVADACRKLKYTDFTEQVMSARISKERVAILGPARKIKV